MPCQVNFTLRRGKRAKLQIEWCQRFLWSLVASMARFYPKESPWVYTDRQVCESLVLIQNIKNWLLSSFSALRFCSLFISFPLTSQWPWDHTLLDVSHRQQELLSDLWFSSNPELWASWAQFSVRFDNSAIVGLEKRFSSSRKRATGSRVTRAGEEWCVPLLMVDRPSTPQNYQEYSTRKVLGLCLGNNDWVLISGIGSSNPRAHKAHWVCIRDPAQFLEVSIPGTMACQHVHSRDALLRHGVRLQF